jgi:hypothetical protein
MTQKSCPDSLAGASGLDEPIQAPGASRGIATTPGLLSIIASVIPSLALRACMDPYKPLAQRRASSGGGGEAGFTH